MSLTTILLLRVTHVVLGVFWVGSVVFVTFFLLPAMRAVGPAAGRVMEELTTVRKMPIFMMAIGVLTILSGGFLLWHDMRVSSGAFMKTSAGRTFSTGATFAILGMIIGGAINSPAGIKLGKIGAAVRASGGAPTAEQAAEMARLQSRLSSAGKVVAVLLILATIAMSVARYVP